MGHPDSTIVPLASITMTGVDGGEEGFPVQLILDQPTRRWFIRGINEAGFGCVDVDLAQLLAWLSNRKPGSMDCDAILSTLSTE